jgi:predicted  nucleic acid-binding Zn-ribbon protein
MGNTEDVVEIKTEMVQFRNDISCIKTDIAVIKEKYNNMSDKINKIGDNFETLKNIVTDIKSENEQQHKYMMKSLLISNATVISSLIGAGALIISVLL